MGITKYEWTEFHDADEAREEVDLCVGISTVDDSGKGKELGSLIYLCPESVFQALLGVFEGGCFLDQVEMG